MDRRRVVITGMGAVTPVGNTVEDSWQAIRQGVCGIAPITAYDTTNQKVKLAGEVKNFDPSAYIDKRELRHLDRFSQLALVAALQAYEQSGLNMDSEDAGRCGVFFGSGIGGFQTLRSECLKGAEKGYDRVSPYFIPMVIGNMAAGHIAIRLGFKGTCTCPVTACASGAYAVGDAFRYVRDGYGEVAMCGGAEAAVFHQTAHGLHGVFVIGKIRVPKRPHTRTPLIRPQIRHARRADALQLFGEIFAFHTGPKRENQLAQSFFFAR